MRFAGAACAVLAIVAACTPIKPVPLSSAPVNTCPCDAYDATQSKIAPLCNSGRCEISTAGNRPEFPFWIVINVPDTSAYAPGGTYALFSDEKGAPTFTRKAAAGTRCIAPLCVQLDGLTSASGNYTVSADISLRARYPLDDGASIPVRVEYDPVGNDTQTTFPSLPLDPTIVSPRIGTLFSQTGAAEFATALPTGIYQRFLYPQPPFDALFPPRIDPSEQAGTLAAPNFLDQFVLSDKTLDPDVGRTVTVNRDDGLDGWQVSIVDSVSQRRISTLKTLSGTSQTVQLDTTGEQNTTGGGLGDVEVVVAPPASFIAVPTFVTQLFGGQQFEIDYPVVAQPTPVEGVVTEPPSPLLGANQQLFGYQAHVIFQSASIATPRAAQATSTLLQYTTELDTDDHGRFSTVLPPGTYNVTTEPAEGTGYATSRSIVVVDADKTSAALTLQPPARTKVTGRVILTDKRPLADADLLAIPQDPAAGGATPKPRPGRSHTANDGSYELDLDEGTFVLTVVPKVGSGFPRVVTRATIAPDSAQLPDILVPPPTPLSFTVRDPTRGFENPVPHAIVRIFALPGISTNADATAAIAAATQNNEPLPQAVEIGEAMTDVNGLVEILLAPGPR